MNKFVPVTFKRSKECAITVDTRKLSKKPFNRLLLGKFTEHLGHNVYSGIWAEILKNPSFSLWKFYENRYKQFKDAGDPDSVYKYVYDVKGMPWPKLLSSFGENVACWWTSFGSAKYLIDPDNAINGDTAQKISVKNEQKGAGVAQSIYLPAHRELDYTLELYAKGSLGRFEVILEKWGKVIFEKEVKGVGKKYRKFTVKFSLPEGAVLKGELCNLKLSVKGTGDIWFDQAFLNPDDHVKGFDPDAVKMLKDSKISLLRFPGGCFASCYAWMDGIGPVEKRPARHNRIWGDEEPNYVGTHEWIDFCRLIGAEPFICVNAGDKSPAYAAEWVEYCNAPANKGLGKLRAKNGHPEPFKVKYWELGNELYGAWEVGYCSAEEYAERYEKFYDAMKKADKTIDCVAMGWDPAWQKVLSKRKGKKVQKFTTHILRGHLNPCKDNKKIYTWYMGSTTDYDKTAREHMKNAKGKVKNPELGITELQLFIHRPDTPNNASQSESLYFAGFLHSGVRNNMCLLTHSAIMNHGGGLRKEKEVVYPCPVHHASKMYGNVPESRVAATLCAGPEFNIDLKLPDVEKIKNAPYIDAISLLKKDKKELNIMALNKHPKKTLKVKITLRGFAPYPGARLQTLNAPEYISVNSVEKPDNATISEKTVYSGGRVFELELEPHSVNKITLKKA